jgi:hypothetical protein
MGLETGTRIPDLVPTNPVGATDFVSAGDDHIRLIKACIQGSFPSIGADAVSLTAAQINDAALKSDNQTIGGTWTFSAPLVLPAASIADASLSSNVPLKNAEATISAAWTFSAAPTLPAASIADASLSSNVPLKNAANVFTHAQTQTIAGGSDIRVINSNNSITVYYGADTSAGYIGTGTNHPFRFYTNNADRGTISAAGNWTINAPVSGATLSLSTAAAAAGISVTGVPTSTLPALVAAGTTTAAQYIRLLNTGGDAVFGVENSAGGDLITGAGQYDTCIRAASTGISFSADNGASVIARLTAAGARIHTILPSTSTTLVSGQIHHITGNATLPALAEQQRIADHDYRALGRYNLLVRNSGLDFHGDGAGARAHRGQRCGFWRCLR